MVDAIHEAGGELFAMTSEPQALATEAEDDWEFGYPAVGDPHQEILTTLRERGLLDIFVNRDCGHLRERPWASHPKGYYQPGVLALTKEGRVLYRWRCRPTRDNMSGAGERPTADYTWRQMQAHMAGADDAPLDENPEFRARDLSWFRFMALLLAHGWFLRPRAFPLARPGDKARVSPRKMNRRIGFFAGAWVAALALLPTSWVAIAFGAWILAIIPGLLEIRRQFQHEPDGEPDPA